MECPNCNETLKPGFEHNCADTIDARRGAVGRYSPTGQDTIWFDACQEKKSGDKQDAIRAIGEYYTKLIAESEDRLSREKRISTILALFFLASVIFNIWLTF